MSINFRNVIPILAATSVAIIGINAFRVTVASVGLRIGAFIVPTDTARFVLGSFVAERSLAPTIVSSRQVFANRVGTAVVQVLGLAFVDY